MKIYLFLVILFCLTACSSLPVAEEAAQNTPASRVATLSPTTQPSDPQPTPKLIATSTLIPSKTPISTSTAIPSLTATPNPTSTPTSTQEPSPSPLLTNTPLPPTPTELPVATSTPIPQQELPPGTQNLIGYYIPFERSAWGETKICDNLVVTGGSQELIQRFVNLVEGGNLVQSLNEQGQPVINLNIETLSSADRARIQNSTPESPVELLVVWPESPGVDALVCYAFIEIVAVR